MLEGGCGGSVWLCMYGMFDDMERGRFDKEGRLKGTT